MKNRLMLIALLVGMLLLLGPWLLLESPSKYWLIVSATGGVLTSLAGYNSQAKMMGRGEPGKDLLLACWSWLNIWLREKIRKSDTLIVDEAAKAIATRLNVPPTVVVEVVEREIKPRLQNARDSVDRLGAQ